MRLASVVLFVVMLVFSSRCEDEKRAETAVKRTWKCPTDECFCLVSQKVDCTDLDLDTLPLFKGDNKSVYDVIDGSNNPLKILQANGLRNINLRSLRITDNHGPLIVHPRALRGLENALEQLVLTNDKIVTLPAKLFRNMIKLKVIDLSDNKIKALTPNMFVGAHNVASLKLQRNNIASLAADSFRGLRHIHHIDLSSNGLAAIDSMTFTDLGTLHVLDLHSNNIRDLQPDTFVNLTQLTALDLSSNKLPALFPRMFAGLSSLEALTLANNPIVSIAPGSMQPLGSLRQLVLAKTKLSRLKATMFDGLTSVRLLFLHSNNISQLEDGVFAPLTGLRKLILDSNNLTTISACAFGNNLKVLKAVSLLGNRITCDCRIRWAALPDVPDIMGKCEEPPTIRGDEIRTWRKYAICSADDTPHDCKNVNSISAYPIKDMKPIWKYYL